MILIAIKKRFLVIIVLLAILLLTLSIYLQVSGHQFLSVDDPAYVLNNAHVKTGLSWDSIAWAFTTFHAEFWHPITWLSYMLDTELFGVRPEGYLFTNLFLHLLNTILVFYGLKYMTGRFWESALVAALFAVHPLHVEPVAWVAERKEVLCAFFWLLSLLAYTWYARKPDIKKYLLLILLFAAGLMSKPMIITLPFLLLLLDYWPLSRLAPIGRAGGLPLRSAAWLVLEKLPLFLLSAGFSLLTVLAQHKGGGIVSVSEYGIYDRIANAVVSYAMYLKKTLWPVDLSVSYPVNLQIPFSVFAVCLLLLIGITLICIRTRRNYPFLLIGWLWFAGTLVPVSGIVKIGDFTMADRFAYFPLIGIFIMAVFGGRRLLDRHVPHRIWLYLIPICLVVTYANASFFQIQVWKNSHSLYSHALEVNPDNFWAHHAMGNLLADKGRLKKAAAHFGKAAKLRPDKAKLWNDLGRALVGVDQWNKGVQCFAESLKQAPDDNPAAHFYLGCALAAGNQGEKALPHFAGSLRSYARKKGRPIRIEKIESEYYKDGAFYLRKGKKKQAIEAYKKAMAEDDACLPALLKLAAIYAEAGKTAKALALYKIEADRQMMQSAVTSGFRSWPLLDNSFLISTDQCKTQAHANQ